MTHHTARNGYNGRKPNGAKMNGKHHAPSTPTPTPSLLPPPLPKGYAEQTLDDAPSTLPDVYTPPADARWELLEGSEHDGYSYVSPEAAAQHAHQARVAKRQRVVEMVFWVLVLAVLMGLVAKVMVAASDVLGLLLNDAALFVAVSAGWL